MASAERFLTLKVAINSKQFSSEDGVGTAAAAVSVYLTMSRVVKFRVLTGYIQMIANQLKALTETLSHLRGDISLVEMMFLPLYF